MMSEMNVHKNLYGIGISPLSIGNKGYAQPEELMTDKNVGIFFINTQDNKIVSAEYVARCKQHLKAFCQRCYDDCTLGLVYKIFINDNHVQSGIVGDDNLLTNEVPVELGNKPAIAFRLGLDVDIFSRDDMHVLNSEDLILNIQFSLIKNGIAKNYFIEGNLDEINTKAYKIDMDAVTVGDGTDYVFRINTLTFKTNSNFDPLKHAIVLYDVLLGLI
jgi:hypothetical protein